MVIISSFLDKFSDEEIRKIIANSKCQVEVLNKLQVSPNSGNNTKKISEYIKQHNIDISHFKNMSTIKRTPENTFIEDSSATQCVLRRMYKKGNYTKYECAICGQQPFWNGKELVLTLDHINGNNKDHRLENLRWICPNCDRQLPTFGAKNKKNKLECKKCGKPLKNRNKTGLCIDCYNEELKKNKEEEYKIKEIILYENENYKTKILKNLCPICKTNLKKIKSKKCVDCENKERKQKVISKISRDELKLLIRTTPFTKIAEIYNVTDNAVRKWCKKYNLPYKSTEIKKYTDEEWKNI